MRPLLFCLSSRPDRTAPARSIPSAPSPLGPAAPGRNAPIANLTRPSAPSPHSPDSHLSTLNSSLPSPLPSRLPPHTPHLHRLRLRLFALLPFLALGAPAAETPASPAPAEDEAALLSAVARAPALSAARHRLAATQARTAAAGRLPDPELEAMGSRVNADAMGENRDMWELNLRQPLPRAGERAADRERAAAAVSLAEAEAAAAAADLATDIAVALAAAEDADRRADLLQAQLERLQSVLRTLEARLAAGVPIRLADRLTVQSRVATLELAVARTRNEAADARAEVHGQLGLPPAAPLPAFAAPAPAAIDRSGFPGLAVANARTAEADAQGRLARASARPMTAVGLRFERERSSMGNQDIVGLAVMSELPFRRRAYARADSRAAAADRAAAREDAVAARHRLAATVSRAERAETLAATTRRLAAGTESRLAAEHELVARTIGAPGPAGSGMPAESAVLHAVAIFEQSTDTQLGVVAADTAARTARAELWRYTPTPLLLRALRTAATLP